MKLPASQKHVPKASKALCIYICIWKKYRFVTIHIYYYTEYHTYVYHMYLYVYVYNCSFGNAAAGTFTKRAFLVFRFDFHAIPVLAKESWNPKAKNNFPHGQWTGTNVYPNVTWGLKNGEQPKIWQSWISDEIEKMLGILGMIIVSSGGCNHPFYSYLEESPILMKRWIFFHDFFGMDQ